MTLTALQNDVAMYLGIHPFDGDGNHAKGDGIYFTDRAQAHGTEVWQAAVAEAQRNLHAVAPKMAAEVLTLAGHPATPDFPTNAPAVASSGFTFTMQEAALLTDSMPSVQEAKFKAAAKSLDAEFLGALNEWEQLTKDLALMSQREKELRQRIFDACFDDPKEGTNKKPLKGGYVLNAQYKLNRTIDAAQLPAVRELLEKENVSFDSVFKFKPDLVTSGYKALTGNAKTVVDMALTIKPGLPTLEIVLPKKAVKA